MTIQETIKRDGVGRAVAVLRVSGLLMDGPSVKPFAGYVEKLYLDGIREIIVDLGEVRWFGASMMGVLTGVLGRTKERGGDVRLARVSKKIDSVLIVACLSGQFRTYDTVEQAVESFSVEPYVSDAVTRANRATAFRWNERLPQYVLDETTGLSFA